MPIQRAEIDPPPAAPIAPIVVSTTLLTNPSAITDEVATVTVPAAPRPAYRQPFFLTGYGTKITRVCGDYGTPTAIGGTWGKVARHHYSKDQPWNHDMSMIYIEQRNNYDGTPPPANAPTKMILDGTSYLPIIGNKNTTNNNALLNASSDFRWRPGYPDQAIGWNSTSQELTVYRLVSQQILFQVHIPHACRKGSTNPLYQPYIRGEGLGFLSEGVISNDGRYFVLCTQWKEPQRNGFVDEFCVVDIEAGIAGIHYANSASIGAGVGPWVAAPMPYVTVAHGEIGWCSISPLGNYAVIKYRTTPEYGRCFNVNQSTLVCTPRLFVVGDSPLHSTTTDHNGWMSCMSHGDFQLSSAPTLGTNIEVYIGGIRDASTSNFCSSAEKDANGTYIAQSMATGKHIHVSMGTAQLGGADEAADQHTSGRCYATPGYMLGTYEHHDTEKFGQHGGELVLWSTLVNGGGAPVRCGCTFTDDADLAGYGGNAGYFAEAHGVPSPGCEKIMFCSNWQKNASPVGPACDYKSYILEPSLIESAAVSDYVPRQDEIIFISSPRPYLNDPEE